jgi:NAD(P)H-dependent flavin oxidoreductase YrpB (nitropropane dioxygenase family)
LLFGPLLVGAVSIPVVAVGFIVNQRTVNASFALGTHA